MSDAIERCGCARRYIVVKERERGQPSFSSLSLVALETYQSCFAYFKGTKGGKGCVCVGKRESWRETVATM